MQAPPWNSKRGPREQSPAAQARFMGHPGIRMGEPRKSPPSPIRWWQGGVDIASCLQAQNAQQGVFIDLGLDLSDDLSRE